MSAEAAVAYLVPVLASCGYRYIHKSTTFGSEENTAPQRVCTAVTVCPIKNSSFQLKLNLLQSKLQSSRDPVCGPYLAIAFTGKLPLPPLTRRLPVAWKGRGFRADALICDQRGIFSLPKHDIITYGRAARAYQTTNY